MIGKNISRILFERKMTIEQLSRLSSVPAETIRNIIYQRVRHPQINTLFAIAAALSVTVEELVCDVPGTDTARLISRYRQCSRHGKYLLNLIADIEADAAQKEKLADSSHVIPCIQTSSASSDGIAYKSCRFSKMRTASYQAFIALCMPDNRFASQFCMGDILLFENRFPNSGEIGLFYHDAELLIRYLGQHPDGFLLRTPCGRSDDIILKRMDSYTIVGTFLEVSRK